MLLIIYLSNFIEKINPEPVYVTVPERESHNAVPIRTVCSNLRSQETFGKSESHIEHV